MKFLTHLSRGLALYSFGLLMLLSAPACDRGTKAIEKDSPNAAPASADSQRQALPNNSFSLRPPAGWTVSKNAESISLSAKSSNGVNFQAREVSYPNSIQDLARDANEGMKKQFAIFNVLDSRTIKTKGGVECERVHFEMKRKDSDQPIRQVAYYFDTRSGHKGFVIFGALATLDEESQPIYTQVMDTVELK